MTVLSFFAQLIDFLFPKQPAVYELESLPPHELLKRLPPAPEISENTLAIWNYADERVRELVWELKYRRNAKVIQSLAVILYDTLKTDLAERGLFENFSNPLLVPIPISTKRRRERGYNQTEVLAEGVIELDTEHLLEYKPHNLEKVRHTESQTQTKNKKERLSNVGGSLRANEEVRGRNIILLDDVTTTGATFEDARRALRDKGAKRIICIALAH